MEQLYARGMAAMVPEEAERQNAAVRYIAEVSLAEHLFLIEEMLQPEPEWLTDMIRTAGGSRA